MLLSCLVGLYWFKSPNSKSLSTACGIGLGIGIAFHNGLFLLQVPLLVSMGLLWMKGIALPRQAVSRFAIALVATSFLMALPSIPFREGVFSYYLLSWFHVYFSVAVAVISLIIIKWKKSKQGLIVLSVVGLLLSLPILSQILDGWAFVNMDIIELKEMPETISPIFGLVAGSNKFTAVLEKYTGLLLLFPLVLAACLVCMFRSERPKEVFFYSFMVFGGFLLLMQFRFHQFGSIALYLPLIYWLQNAVPANAGGIRLLVIGLIGAAYIPVFDALQQLPSPGGSYDYALTRSVYRPLAQACRKEPGVVLADHNDGHYVRFHTECSVIANNLILTDKSREKVQLVNRLFAMNSSELRRNIPSIKYILVRRNDNVLGRVHSIEEVRRLNAGLRQELLFNETVPKGYRVIYELKILDEQKKKVPLASIFEVLP